MKITDGINFIWGGIIAAFTYIFGGYWVFFALFLLFNVIDWITGWMKSKMAGKENSVKGLTGVAKKLGYWLMVVLAFSVGYWLVVMCRMLGIDEQTIPWSLGGGLGWFVLASLSVNEVRSILENFIAAGFDVPVVLKKGLEIAEKTFDDEEKTT